jgi:hypothetical protein
VRAAMATGMSLAGEFMVMVGGGLFKPSFQGMLSP